MMTTEYIIALLLANMAGMLYSAGINLAHAVGYLSDWEYKWIEVAAGVVLTLVWAPLFLPWRIVLQILSLFVCTGGWMVVGCIARWTWKHRRNNAALAEKKRRKMDKVEEDYGPTA